MNNELIKAIKYLKPNAQFVITDDDYSTIVWHELDGDAPTQKEIDVAMKQIKLNEAAEAKAQAEAKAALLDRLGITEDEAKLLLA
jgi:hypothetical protein